MNATIERCRLAGIRLRVEGGTLCYDAPKGAMTPELMTGLKADKPDIIAALTHPDLSGVSPEFTDRLFAEDREDIKAGDIPLGTVHAFEQAAIAREAEDLREHFEERAGILERDAGLTKDEAELEAARSTTALARNRGCLWASLREALEGSTVPLAQVPEADGSVDDLVFGVAGVHVGKDGLAVRQGTFSGAHEVRR
jgi:hypothetical protein